LWTETLGNKTDFCAIWLHSTKSQIGESGEIAKLSPPGERGLSNAEKRKTLPYREASVIIVTRLIYWKLQNAY